MAPKELNCPSFLIDSSICREHPRKSLILDCALFLANLCYFSPSESRAEKRLIASMRKGGTDLFNTPDRAALVKLPFFPNEGG